MLRVAVLGCAPLLDAAAPASVPGVLEVVELPEDDALARLGTLAVDAVVAFEPDPALASRLDAPALLWSAGAGRAPPGSNQRLVCGVNDPRAWRCLSLPVADRHYADGTLDGPPRAAWLGPPTARRSAYLSWFSHAEPPLDDGSDAVVAVNMHEDGAAAFEPRVARALAGGRLLVSETLVPARGLEAGIDYLAAGDLDELYLAVEAAVANPRAFRRVHLRGRRKAELFRASAVVRRLIEDLLVELGSSASS